MTSSTRKLARKIRKHYKRSKVEEVKGEPKVEEPKAEEPKKSEQNITIAELSEIIGATLPVEIDGNAVCGRLITQSQYTNPGEVVFACRWYNKERTVREALERGGH